MNYLLCCAKFVLSLEALFCTGYLFLVLLSFNLRRYPDENEDNESKYLNRMFAFGITYAFLAVIIISISNALYKPKVIFITNLILILIKAGLYIAYFISLYKIRESKDHILLITIFPEVVFIILIIINDASKLTNQNNNHQNNN